MELNSLDMPALLAELGANYDPDRLADALRDRPWDVRKRALRIATTLGTFLTSLLQDYAIGRFEANMPKRAGQLRKILGGLGPSFVKVGQALSARPDLMPPVYLRELGQLQDQLPAFPTTIAMALVEEELGRKLGDVFSQLSEEPVNAASLGQVYRGILRETGEEVAVKVQRPGIADSIAIDMLLLRRLMAAVDRNIPQVSQPLAPLVDEFAARLFGELDYEQEGRSCEKFQEMYGNVPRVRAPRIIWQASGRRVLTMEWIEGVKLTDRARMAEAGLSIVDFVDVGIECTLRQLLDKGYFHADPHPGNLLATTSGDLVYLDFGMMSEAPQSARYAIIQHVVHLVNRDYAAMCRDYYILDFVDPSVDTSPIAPELARFFDDVLDSSVSKLNFKAIVDGLGGVLFQYPFQVPAYYALILRSLTVLEGLALSADPDYRLLGRAYPYMASRILTDPAPQLRASLEELILSGGGLRWNRLENLLEESNKSQAFDVSGLWLLAEWVVSEAGAGVRKPVIAEAVRMLDALIAEQVRRRIAGRAGGTALAQRLVPAGPREELLLARAHLLSEALGEQLSSGAPLLQVAGSGPWGLTMPQDLGEVVNRIQAAAAPVMPRLQALMARPGAAQARDEIIAGLQERAAARSVQLFFGYTAGDGTGAEAKQAQETSPAGRRMPGPQRLLA